MVVFLLFLFRHRLAASSLKYTSSVKIYFKILWVLGRGTELQRPSPPQPVATTERDFYNLKLEPPGGTMSDFSLWHVLLFNSQSL